MSHAAGNEDTALDLDRERAIDAHQASDLTGLAVVTLAQLRARGEGPPWFRASGRAIRYRLGDVIAWRDARKVGSTKGGAP